MPFFNHTSGWGWLLMLISYLGLMIINHTSGWGWFLMVISYLGLIIKGCPPALDHYDWY